MFSHVTSFCDAARLMIRSNHRHLRSVATQVAAFQRPHLPQQRQQHMDIVCGVEFSGDGWHLATAGIRKQVCQSNHI